MKVIREESREKWTLKEGLKWKKKKSQKKKNQKT